jgi:hypothetical protein
MDDSKLDVEGDKESVS